MAMIEKLEKSKESFNLGRQTMLTKTTYSITEQGGEKFLKIVTYGSKERKNPNSVSQNIVFNTKILRELQKIIRDEMQL